LFISLTEAAEKLWPHNCSVTALTLRVMHSVDGTSTCPSAEVETPWTYISAKPLTKAGSER
jgi:hypothetical protein